MRQNLPVGGTTALSITSLLPSECFLMPVDLIHMVFALVFFAVWAMAGEIALAKH